MNRREVAYSAVVCALCIAFVTVAFMMMSGGVP